MIELWADVEISIDDVNTIWTMAKQRTFLRNDGYMRDMDGVLKLAKQALGFAKPIFTVGIIEDRKTVYWDWTKNYPELQQTAYKIETLKTFGKTGTHFVLCDKDGELIFDSYSFKPYRFEHIGRYHLFNHY
jgi:hypothetical protein